MIADIKMTTTTTPFIDEISIDIAAQRGRADATEGRGYTPEPWVTDSRFCLASYDAAFAAGQTLVAQLAGSDVEILPTAQLSEGEFMGAMLTAMRSGNVPMVRMTKEQAYSIEACRPGEWEYCNRGAF